MQKYELLYILPTKYTDEEIGGVISKLTEEMKASGVNIVRAEQAGKLKLAYPIRHQRYGYYVIAAIEAEFEGSPGSSSGRFGVFLILQIPLQWPR